MPSVTRDPLNKAQNPFSSCPDEREHRVSRAVDKKLEVWWVQAMEDAAGRLIGRYQGRPNATKAVGQVAYQPVPRR
jgi:hypothetical protein